MRTSTLQTVAARRAATGQAAHLAIDVSAAAHEQLKQARKRVAGRVQQQARLQRGEVQNIHARRVARVAVELARDDESADVAQHRLDVDAFGGQHGVVQHL